MLDHPGMEAVSNQCLLEVLHSETLTPVRQNVLEDGERPLRVDACQGAELQVGHIACAHVGRARGVFLSLQNSVHVLQKLQGAILLEDILHLGTEECSLGAWNALNLFCSVLHNGQGLAQRQASLLQPLD